MTTAQNFWGYVREINNGRIIFLVYLQKEDETT